jgi:hypothetical protein
LITERRRLPRRLPPIHSEERLEEAAIQLGGRTRQAKTPALALGQYDYPDQRLARDRGRSLFLRTVERHHPTVLEQLRAVTDESTLRVWANDRHLSDDWILDVARRGVLPASANSDGISARWNLTAAVTFSLDEIIDEDDRATIDDLARPQAADPIIETAQEYFARVERHWIATTTVLRARGLKPTARADPTHFRWLAAYQVDNKKFSELGTDASTAHTAIRQLAKVIGLTLRPTRPGRPRK